MDPERSPLCNVHHPNLCKPNSIKKANSATTLLSSTVSRELGDSSANSEDCRQRSRRAQLHLGGAQLERCLRWVPPQRVQQAQRQREQRERASLVGCAQAGRHIHEQGRDPQNNLHMTWVIRCVSQDHRTHVK